MGQEPGQPVPSIQQAHMKAEGLYAPDSRACKKPSGLSQDSNVTKRYVSQSLTLICRVYLFRQAPPSADRWVHSGISVNPLCKWNPGVQWSCRATCFCGAAACHQLNNHPRLHSDCSTETSGALIHGPVRVRLRRPPVVIRCQPIDIEI